MIIATTDCQLPISIFFLMGFCFNILVSLENKTPFVVNRAIEIIVNASVWKLWIPTT